MPFSHLNRSGGSYDNGNDAGITRRDDIDIATHDTFYNPEHPARTEIICPRGDSSAGNGCVTRHYPGYSAASAYRGNVTKVTSFSDATLATDPNANVNNYGYDIAGNVVSATLSCCQLKLIEYGDTFAETGYAYPTSEIKGTSPTQLIKTTAYNRNTGLVVNSTDENNQSTEYQYEADTLRPKKTIYPNGGYVLSEYSDKLVTTQSELLPGFVRMTSPLETNKTVQSYRYFNGRGEVIRSATQTPDGWSISAVKYDKLGRAIQTYNPFYASTPTGAIPANTKYTEVAAIDALGRATSVKLQDDTTVSTVFSDANSMPAGFNKTFVTVTDQAGKQRRQIMDALGRIIRVDEPDGNGNLGAVDAPAQPTAYEYDGNDNLKKVIQSDGTTTQERIFKYDSLSRLKFEKQVEATATLNDDGLKVSSGGLWTKVLKYNTDNLLIEGVDARGVKMTFGYDTLNRITSATYSDGTPTVTYTYDQARSGFFNNGELTRIETADGETVRPDTPATATELDYDKIGRVVKHTQTIGSQNFTLEYGYNLAGQLTSEKYPSGKIVNINYDANGRLSGIADQTRTYLSNLQYQGNGNSVNSMSFGNGTNQTFGFNERLQMTNQTLSRNSEILQKYDYGYGQIDTNGNLDTSKNNGQLAKIESHIGATKQWTQKFSYDSIGRLNESKEYRGDTNALSYKQKFDFDSFGNLYRKNASNSVSGQQTPLGFTTIEEGDINKAKNQINSTAQNPVVYDDAGNMTQDGKFRNINFLYDANGRMFKTSNLDSTNQADSVYDALGNRVATKIADVWTFFIYNAFGKLVAEYGGLQAEDEGGVKYILQDWQGSSRAIVSQNGYVQARMDYTAFGEEIYANVGLRTTAQGFNENNNLSQKYALTERDKATGLDHTWFRKNENRAGRWTSPDPYNGSMSIGNPQSFNRYSYVESQPTNFIDPSGLRIDQVCGWVGITAGAKYTAPDGTVTDIPAVSVYRCTIIFSSGGGGGGGGGGGTGVGIGGGGTQTQNLSPVEAERERIRKNVKENCIKREQRAKSSGQNRNILKGCGAGAATGAIGGFKGGGLIGLLTGPGAPLVGVGGAIIGGIIGCAAGSLSAGTLTAIEQSFKEDIEKVCEKEANDAVAPN